MSEKFFGNWARLWAKYFWIFSDKYSEFEQNFFGCLVKTAFYVSGETFWILFFFQTCPCSLWIGKSQISEKEKVYILREWFSRRNILRAKLEDADWPERDRSFWRFKNFRFLEMSNGVQYQELLSKPFERQKFWQRDVQKLAIYVGR